MVAFSGRPFPKNSASMYESSGSQFFKTTTGIQSGPDTFDESRFVMTFLTLLAASRTLLQQLLVCLSPTSDSEDLI